MVPMESSDPAESSCGACPRAEGYGFAGGAHFGQNERRTPNCTSRWSRAPMAAPVAGTSVFPAESTSAVELTPTTLSVFVRFVVSARNSRMYRSAIGKNRE